MKLMHEICYVQNTCALLAQTHQPMSRLTFSASDELVERLVYVSRVYGHFA